MKHRSSLVILAAAALLPGAVGYSYAGTLPSFELLIGEAKEIYKNLASDSLNVTVIAYNPCLTTATPVGVKLTSSGKGGQQIEVFNQETKVVTFNVSKQQSIVADCFATSGCGSGSPGTPNCGFTISVP